MKYFIALIISIVLAVPVFAEDTPAPQLADRPEITQAVAAGGEAIAVDVLGVVCDFCAVAMKKTLGKHDDVAAVYVDLDTKVLSLVLNTGAAMDDAIITKLIKKAGYKVASINRLPAGAAPKDEAAE